MATAGRRRHVLAVGRCRTAISRKAYGVSFEAAFGAGNAVVADKVEIDLELEFVRNAD